MTRPHGGGKAALLLAVLALGPACVKRPEAADGTTGEARANNDGTDTSTGVALPTQPRQTIRQNPAADEALAAVQARKDSLGRRQQVDAYMRVWKAYPATTAGEEALYDAGSVAYAGADYVAARKAFNELLFENPLYARAADAKEKLGLSALETHAFRDAFQTLMSLVDRASGADRQRLLEAADRAAEGAQLWGPTLDIALKFVTDAQGPEAQKAALGRVTDLVEGKVPFLEVARAQQGLPATHPAWPVLTFKLARIYYHLRDWTRLQETLTLFLQQAPQSPFAADAQAMLARANQSGKVAPNVVGVILPLSGNLKLLGEAALRGIQLALKNSGVKLVVKDSKGDVSLAVRALEELALDDGAIAVIGPLAGDEARHTAVSAEELGVPLLTMTRQEGITDLGPHIFRNMLTYSAQTRALVDYSTRVLGFKSFAVLYPNAPFGKEFANDFWDDVLAKGGVVRGAESYSNDQTTFNHEVKKLVGRFYLEDRREYVENREEISKSAADSFRKKKAFQKARKNLEPIVDFDALFIPDDWSRVGLLAPALAVEDIITNACDERDIANLKKTTGKDEVKTVTLLGVSSWSSPKNADGIPELLARGGKFVLCSIYVDGFFADSDRPATKRFMRLYTESYRDTQPPGLLEAMAYDSGKMVRAVIDGQHPFTREAFRTGLAGLKNLEGATGRVSFNDKREPERELFFITVDAKGIHEVKPPQKVTGL